MAYDVRPLVTMEEKAALLAEAVREKQILFFEHDPVADAGFVVQDAKGRIALERTGTLAELLDVRA